MTAFLLVLLQILDGYGLHIEVAGLSSHPGVSAASQRRGAGGADGGSQVLGEPTNTISNGF